MVAFPRTEQDVVALAEQMITGLTEHMEDFPTVTASSVQVNLDAYKEGKDAYDQSQAQVDVTVDDKNAALNTLIGVMKTDLKKAEIDVGSDSPKLSEIGWGPKAEPQPLVAPGQPAELHPIAEGQGMIWLQWNRPASGGAVWNYVIERQQQAEGGQPGQWVIAASVYNTDCKLTNQPENVRLAYQVKAVNAAGESMPRSIVSVVLP